MRDKDTYEIRLAGYGGQGLVTVGKVLAKAVTTRGNYNVCQTKSYGPESRGGAARSEVIISKGRIFFPKAQIADILLALSQPAFDKYKDQISDDAVVLVDADLVSCPESEGLYKIPFTAIAEKEIGVKVTANIVALGAIHGLLGNIVDRDAVVGAIRKEVPPGTEEVNIRAFEAGLKAAGSLHLRT